MGQLGNSPSGCEVAARRLQLHVDLPHYLGGVAYTPAHVPADIKNAHSDVSRDFIRKILVEIVSSPAATDNDKLNLIYFDLFYTYATRTIVLTDGILSVAYQNRALDQGDGMANFFFNLAYGVVISRHVTPRFPLASFILIHDDTTILGPIAVSASDEFNGSRSPRPRAPTERDDGRRGELNAACQHVAPHRGRALL